MVKIFTIGFTKSSARNFFERLQHAGPHRIVDVRLKNASQLSGFAKKDDLKFFAEKLCGMDYTHDPRLAPTKEMLDDYKKRKGSWPDYERRFLDLMADRRIEEIAKDELDGACLLCSEDKPHHCHRRLVAEYLKTKWTDVTIIHL